MIDRGAWIWDPDPSCDVGSGSGLSRDVDPVKIRQWIRNATANRVNKDKKDGKTDEEAIFASSYK